MDLPAIVAPAPLTAVSASFYNAAVICKARGAWLLTGVRDSLPGTTGAILGTAFHQVMRMANSGKLPGGAAEAKAEFDRTAQALFDKAHPMLRAKFPNIERLPFYHQRRSRAAAMASKVEATEPVVQQTSGDNSSRVQPAATGKARYVEHKFKSKDGLISGTIDLLDPEKRKLTDYKSGFTPQGGSSAIAESEARQLRLYVYLAHDNEIEVDEAEIVRADGAHAGLKVTREEAAAEGESARKLRHQFNVEVEQGASFENLASPSSAACSGCPCIPFCEAFWKTAVPDWEDECGTHTEGTVTDVRVSQMTGASLETLIIDATRGTIPSGSVTVEQIPWSWLELGGAPPATGSRIRVAQAARQKTDAAPDPRVLRVDRLKSTTIWNA